MDDIVIKPINNDAIVQIRNKFKGKKVLVVGLGSQGGGTGLVKFLSNLGAIVKVTDLKTADQLKDSLAEIKSLNIEYTLGKHDINDFLNCEYIFKGPSVPWNLPELEAANKKGIPIDMELAFFAEYCPAKIIGITGTRGKSTTTNLIYQLLKQNNYPVYLAGSIPQVSTVSLLNNVSSNDWVVLELPSWPLSGFHRKKISPHIAVFTNLYPDHLNYYQSMADYLYDKKAIYYYQKSEDYLIANQSLSDVIDADKPKSKIIYFSQGDFNYPLHYLLGGHNQENAAAALKVGELLKINRENAIKIIGDFKGLTFRQEIIKEKNQIIFINDTTSTTPIATIKAIDTFSSKPIILILGGNAKNLPVEDLIVALKQVEKIVLLKGNFTDAIIDRLKKDYPNKIIGVFADLSQAVNAAYDQAIIIANLKKDKVNLLFSPAATSFAMFNNEFHRGEEYNKIVRKIFNENP